MSELATRYAKVLAQVETRALAANRDLKDITVIVVSKNHGADLVRELYGLGQRHFGENRDQEAAPKAAATADLTEISWHFIGQLQSNKVRSAMSYSSTIHSIDRESVLSAIGKNEGSAPISGFIQLNLTDDPGRGGIEPKNLLAFAESALALPNLALLGVMGVAALDRDPRLDFETISKASEQLMTLTPEAKYISAGMSHDFEEAIDFGATHLRIGTAITGNRNL